MKLGTYISLRATSHDLANKVYNIAYISACTQNRKKAQVFENITTQASKMKTLRSASVDLPRFFNKIDLGLACIRSVSAYYFKLDLLVFAHVLK